MLSNLTFNQSTLNITYRQGTDAALQLTLKDSTNTAVDATGATVKMVVKLNYTSPTNLITITSPTDITITNNQVSIYFRNDCVKGFIKDKSTSAVYQIELTFANGQKQVLLEGSFTVLKDIVS